MSCCIYRIVFKEFARCSCQTWQKELLFMRTHIAICTRVQGGSLLGICSVCAVQGYMPSVLESNSCPAKVDLKTLAKPSHTERPC